MRHLAPHSNARVHFINCDFINNKPLSDKQNIHIKGHRGYGVFIVYDELIKLFERITTELYNCTFHGKNDDTILGTHGNKEHPRKLM